MLCAIPADGIHTAVVKWTFQWLQVCCNYYACLELELLWCLYLWMLVQTLWLCYNVMSGTLQDPLIRKSCIQRSRLLGCRNCRKGLPEMRDLFTHNALPGPSGWS